MAKSTKKSSKSSNEPTFEIEDGKLIITAPLAKKPTESGSGKSWNYLSITSRTDTGLEIDGKPLIVGLNAYCKK